MGRSDVEIKNHFFSLQRKFNNIMEMKSCLDEVQGIKSTNSSSSVASDQPNMVLPAPISRNHYVPNIVSSSTLADQFNYEQPNFTPFLVPQQPPSFFRNSEERNAYFSFMNSCRPSGLVISKASSQDINGVPLNTNNMDMHNMMNNSFMNSGMMGQQATNSLHLLPRPPSLNIEKNAKRHKTDFHLLNA